MDWTPAMALDEARQECEREDPDACVVIFLNRTNGAYDTNFLQSGMSMTELVSLLEIQKSRIITRYINNQGSQEETEE